jgi:hypothetical protein
MKKFAFRTFLFCAAFLFGYAVVGCAKPAPLPTGAINAVDAGLNANLQAAHAAVVQYESDVTAGKHTPTPTEKTVVNNLIRALNTADPLYQSYHAALQKDPTAGEPQQLIDAVTAVTANLSSIQNLIQGAK